MKRALLIMAKQPIAGQTKTRLCPPLSYEEAAALYECFLRDTLEVASDAARRQPEIQPGIAYAPENTESYFANLAPDCALIAQRGNTLGARLDHVLSSFLACGFGQAAAINSDGPTLPPEYLAAGFTLLDDPAVDAVFGPSEDGGYYFIGIKQPAPRLVRDVEMSTPKVLQETLSIAEEEGVRTALLPTWYDVDTGDELARLRRELCTLPPRVAQYTRAFLLKG